LWEVFVEETERVAEKALVFSFAASKLFRKVAQ